MRSPATNSRQGVRIASSQLQECLCNYPANCEIWSHQVEGYCDGLSATRETFVLHVLVNRVPSAFVDNSPRLEDSRHDGVQVAEPHALPGVNAAHVTYVQPQHMEWRHEPVEPQFLRWTTIALLSVPDLLLFPLLPEGELPCTKTAILTRKGN